MREKLLNNCRIIDPSQKKDEIGGILIDNNGKIFHRMHLTLDSDLVLNIKKILEL